MLLHVYYFFTTCLILFICFATFKYFVILRYYFSLLLHISYNVLLFLYIFTVRLRLRYSYPVVITTWVRDLGPPGSSTSQILGTFSGFSETLLAERETPREDPLGSGRIP